MEEELRNSKSVLLISSKPAVISKIIMNEISSKVGEPTSVCATYIKNLITLGIVKKESPCGEKSGRRTIYSIEDKHYYLFAKTDFTKACIDKANEMGNVILVKYADMLK